ncbi:MAG: TolC family protein [Fulvivirga sp.]|nr:TolC family protein [Fulvivirga sp.]
MKIYKLSILLIFLLSTLEALAQRTDYNAVIIPLTAKNVEFQEKLVQLAWQNHPSNKIALKKVESAKYDVIEARWSFLDNIGIQGNINEFVLRGDVNDNQALFFPRYNISATLKLGMFIKTPVQTKKMKTEYAIMEEEVKQQKLAVRAEVLRRYYEYNTNRELLNIEVQALEDARNTYRLMEQKFQSGEATLDEYNTALNNFNGQRSKKIKAEGNLLQSKVTLEEIIGVRLEDVEQ